MSTVSAVLIGCGSKHGAGIRSQLHRLSEQTHTPGQVIVATCCGIVDSDFITTNIVVPNHADDWGHYLCHQGLQLAEQDYVCFVNSDDEYDPEFFERMLRFDASDLIYCDYTSHLIGGAAVSSIPKVGFITRGSFLVRTQLAQVVGYNHRVYEADGLFVEDVLREADTYTHHVHEVLMHHK